MTLTPLLKQQSVRWNTLDTQKYDEGNSTHLKGYLARIDQVYLEVCRGRRAVLEIGSGTGRLLEKLAHLNIPLLAGLDLAEHMLRSAQSKGITNLTTGMGESIPFKDQSFDAIVSAYYVFRYLDRTQAYKEANRLLKPQGVLAFDLLNYYTVLIEFVLARLIRGQPINKQGMQNSYFFLNTKNITREVRALEQAGFHVTLKATPYLPFLRRFVNTDKYLEGKWTKLGYNLLFICTKR